MSVLSKAANPVRYCEFPIDSVHSEASLDKESLMTVKIDADLCTACGLCTDDVPDVFTMGDEVAEVTQADVPADMEGAVQDAVDSCPSEAIIVE